MVIRSKPGMQPERHRSLSGAGVTFVRSDPELIERVRQAKRQLFHADQLPEHQLYKEEECDE